MQRSTGSTEEIANTQAYGALATRLTDALAQVRRALEPHVAHVPGATLAELDTLLTEFARRRIRIALYGEVKAGKSTLLNALAGGALSPVAFEPLTSIPVRVTYGGSTAWHLGEQRLDSAAALERVMRDGHSAAGEVVVETNLDLLHLGGQVDLLDTPGVGSDAQFDAVTADALRALDAVVLVVRYPALFTQFTRRLVDSLETDIGKLFVVWNLDTACAELSAADRSRHADTLRANVAGAHELFLVDARAGMQARDAAQRAACGLEGLSSALTRFVSSGGRELAAIREAAKRSQQWLAATQAALTQRHATLARALADARQRLEKVRSAAAAAAEAARVRRAEFDTTVGRIAQENTAAANKLADDFRKQLRAGRSRWVSTGNLTALDTAVRTAVEQYADAAAAASRTTHERLQAESKRFGSAVDGEPRTRTALGVGQLTSDERGKRATTGKAQWLRRSVWRGWYLPGLTTLERASLAQERTAQVKWLEDIAAATRSDADRVLASRLATIAQRAEAETQQIKDETHYDAVESEFTQLGEHLPVVATVLAGVTAIGTEARALVRQVE